MNLSIYEHSMSKVHGRQQPVGTRQNPDRSFNRSFTTDIAVSERQFYQPQAMKASGKKLPQGASWKGFTTSREISNESTLQRGWNGFSERGDTIDMGFRAPVARQAQTTQLEQVYKFR